MSTHSPSPGIPDASPTIPGDNTSASYGTGDPGASLRVTVRFSMSTLSTVVFSLRSTPGSRGAASFSGHVVCEVSTRPHHAYAHVPPMVNQSLASTRTTLRAASFATALASVCAHPRPPKPAPTMTTRDMLFDLCLGGREANARACLARRARAREWGGRSAADANLARTRGSRERCQQVCRVMSSHDVDPKVVRLQFLSASFAGDR